jgi:DNA-binding MarR family transcriptional regulator
MDSFSLDFFLVLVCRAHFKLASDSFSTLKLQRSWPGVLLQLEKGDGMDQTELSKNLEVTTATMTNLLNRMENAGLVKRCKDCRDSRVSNIFLTEEGRKILSEVKITISQIEQKTFNGFSAEEKAQVREYLERMHQNMIQD